MQRETPRMAKIVCTLGPASDDRDTIRQLAEAGMSVARINASHGTHEDRSELVERIRSVDLASDHTIATMLDLQGPEIRTATVDEPFEIQAGEEVRFVEGNHASPDRIGLSVNIGGVEVGDRVLVDDGRIETTVVGFDEDDGAVVARVDVGGELESRRGVNVPGAALDIDVPTEADEKDLELAAEEEVDFVAASFVRDAADVLSVNEVLERHGADVPIVAKIERADAVENLDEIIETAYGVMVARGDLGVECPLEDVPMIQKRIIRRSKAAGVPVITATEMLDSMIEQPRPTRAEASDVANAVLDGTDAVMLSGETAVGNHPVDVVDTMDDIVRAVETSDAYGEFSEQRVPPAERTNSEAIARSGRYLVRDIGGQALVVASETGYTARKTSKFRPGVPIVAATPTDRVRRKLAVSWGVNAQSTDLETGEATQIVDTAVDAALESNVVKSGDTVVVLSGMMREVDRSFTNTLKIHVAAETVGVGRGVVSGSAAGPLVRTTDGDLSETSKGSILALKEDFDGEFDGEATRIAGILHARDGMTGYPAMVARELGIPMISGVDVAGDVEEGATVTIDGDRGVVYAGDVRDRSEEQARRMREGWQ